MPMFIIMITITPEAKKRIDGAANVREAHWSEREGQGDLRGVEESKQSS